MSQSLHLNFTHISPSLRFIVSSLFHLVSSNPTQASFFFCVLQFQSHTGFLICTNYITKSRKRMPIESKNDSSTRIIPTTHTYFGLCSICPSPSSGGEIAMKLYVGQSPSVRMGSPRPSGVGRCHQRLLSSMQRTKSLECKHKRGKSKSNIVILHCRGLYLKI